MCKRMALIVLAAVLCGAAWNDGALRSDAFDLADGTHLGASWTTRTRGRWYVRGGSARNLTGEVGIHGTPMASGDCTVIAYVHAEVAARGGVVARSNSGGTTCYIADISCGTRDYIRLTRRVNGEDVLLGQAQLQPMYGVNGYVKLVCSGSRLRVYRDDVLYIDVTDNALGGRHVGIVASPFPKSWKGRHQAGISLWMVKP